MVAYSFQKRFVGRVMAGLEPGPWLPGMKRHTLRRPREGRARHARVGEPMQLYTAMRTRHCRLLGRVDCCAVLGVQLVWMNDVLGICCQGARLPREQRDAIAPIILLLANWVGREALFGDQMDEFARTDGFEDWQDMARFFDPPGHDATIDLVLLAWRPA